MTPFATTYDYDGIALNVSGDADYEDCWITKVTAADSQIDISDLFSVHALEMIAASIHAKLENEGRESRAEARAELHIWNHEFRIAA